LAQIQLGYRLIGRDGVTVTKHGDREFLEVAPRALTHLTEVAMHDISHYLRTEQLQQLAKIVKDPESSANDRFVALDLLKNANIAAGGSFADVPRHWHCADYG
jgi:fumarate hydratase class I